MRRLDLQDLKNATALTREGASAYDLSGEAPLTHLCFSFGSAVFSPAYYETEREQVRRFAKALVDAAAAEPAFPWQYAAWMRDPKAGKGNRIQGTLAPALLDALLPTRLRDEDSIARLTFECLRFRVDDSMRLLAHYQDLGLGSPSKPVRRALARALSSFDEYQLLKYARPSWPIRLCDALAFVRSELEDLGASSSLARTMLALLHAPTRKRLAVLSAAAKHEGGMVPLTLASARRELFALSLEEVQHDRFAALVDASRVTWEQLVGQFTLSARFSRALPRALQTLVRWKRPVVFDENLWSIAYAQNKAVFRILKDLTALAGDADCAERVKRLAGRLRAGSVADTFAIWSQQLCSPKALNGDLSYERGLLRSFLEESCEAPDGSLYRELDEVLSLSPALKCCDEIARTLIALRNGSKLELNLENLRKSLSSLRGALLETADSDSRRALLSRIETAEAELASPELITVLAQHRALSLEADRQIARAKTFLNQFAEERIPISELRDFGQKLKDLLSKVSGFSFSTNSSLVARLEAKYAALARVLSRTSERVELELARVEDAKNHRARNAMVWRALLSSQNLLPDFAFLRNLRTLIQLGLSSDELIAATAGRRFHGIWPHQIYAGYKSSPEAASVFEAIFARFTDLLPPGCHLGIADASGSMSVKVGGLKGSVTAKEVALCLTALMSESSRMGASFSDGSWGPSGFLALARRGAKEKALEFSKNPALDRLMGGTQVFGAILELIQRLRADESLLRPDCLWFFSDMQFHPAEGALTRLPADLMREAQDLGLGAHRPPLELAIELYRSVIGPVDVVLWNLAAYSAVPVPAGMKGVLLVSGFDANTLKQVTAWRSGALVAVPDGAEPAAQEAVLQLVRSY